jgi:protein phosphatase 1B
MGSFLDKPKTEKTNDHGDGNDLRYGLSAMQGWRVEMEDAHSSQTRLPRGLDTWSFFAVFDGHAGGTVSKQSSTKLLHSILDADPDLFKELAKMYTPSNSNGDGKNSTTNSNGSNNKSPVSSPRSSTSSLSPTKNSTVSATNNNNNSPTNESKQQQNSQNSPPTKSENADNTNLSNGNATTTTTSTKNSTTSTLNSPSSNNLSSNTTASTAMPSSYTPEIEKRLEQAIRKGFLDLDENLRNIPELNRGEDKSGSTAVACLISPSHVYLINCGDSRAIVCSDNQVAQCTVDHKPVNQSERERIQNAGGSVMIQRVNGSLAVSRALGDYEYKSVEGRGPCEQLVSPEPEIFIHKRQSDKDEFVCLACDGIWDVMTNENLKEYIHSRLKVTDDLVKISDNILDMCLNKGSRDNMSIIIVSFPGAPKVTQDEIDKDNNINEKIENRIKEMIEGSNTKIEFSQVISKIAEEKWEFPPGGGLQAKQSVIEEIFNRLVVKNNEDDTINPGSYVLNSPM